MSDTAATADITAAAHVRATTVVAYEQGLSLTLTAIPRDALPGGIPDSLDAAVEALGAELLVELPRPAASWLPHAIASILPDADASSARERLEIMLSLPPRQGLADVDPAVLAFAEYCSFTPIIPMEESRLSAKVLAQIVGFGGVVGVATIATAPIIVGVASAAGTIVVLSAAAGVGERVYSWIAP